MDLHVDVPAAAGLDLALQGFDFPQLMTVGRARCQALELRDPGELTRHAVRHEVAYDLGRFVGELLLEETEAQTSGFLDGAGVGLLAAL